MSDKELNELGNLESESIWDFDKAERHEPSKNRRTVVSVGLPHDDFVIVSVAAERAGIKLSTYIRIAAVEAAKGAKNTGRLSWEADGSTESAFFTSSPSTTEPFVHSMIISKGGVDGNLIMTDNQ